MKGIAHKNCLSRPDHFPFCSPASVTRPKKLFTRRRPRGSSTGLAAGNSAASTKDLRVCHLPVNDLTPGNFEPFGQVVGPSYDGKEYGAEDAQLVLDQGTPRFYIMRLPRRGLSFDRITYHAKVTQCLGSIGLQPWYMAVAAPSGSVEEWPRPEDLHAFRIPAGTFIKLHQGTWHAGPLFEEDSMAFYNLELSDTNVVDHNTHDYSTSDLQFLLVDK
ncbi:g10315 [Coccomyxa elongata]